MTQKDDIEINPTEQISLRVFWVRTLALLLPFVIAITHASAGPGFIPSDFFFVSLVLLLLGSLIAFVFSAKHSLRKTLLYVFLVIATLAALSALYDISKSPPIIVVALLTFVSTIQACKTHLFSLGTAILTSIAIIACGAGGALLGIYSQYPELQPHGFILAIGPGLILVAAFLARHLDELEGLGLSRVTLKEKDDATTVTKPGALTKIILLLFMIGLIAPSTAVVFELLPNVFLLTALPAFAITKIASGIQDDNEHAEVISARLLFAALLQEFTLIAIAFI